MNQEEIIGLFCADTILSVESVNTSHDDLDDFREALFVKTPDKRFVIKLADNGFTDAAHVTMWATLAEKYRMLGYYTPTIFPAKDGTFPQCVYKEHSCIAYGEEYSIYQSADSVAQEMDENGLYHHFPDAIRMNARIAAQEFDFTDLPSAYCLFAPFDPTDEVDEVEENALTWKTAADQLPQQLLAQVQRIWDRWQKDKSDLKKIYSLLPRSVFQADINASNVLLNEAGDFQGVLDFNIAGRDVFLNLLFREVPYVCTQQENRFKSDDYYAESIKSALRIASEVYTFSDTEKQAAPLLYRYILPMWKFHSMDYLNETAPDQIQNHLDSIEYEQTREIDFTVPMTNG